MINENKLAKEVSVLECGKTNMPIGQIKECVKDTLDVLAHNYKMSEVVALIEKHK